MKNRTIFLALVAAAEVSANAGVPSVDRQSRPLTQSHCTAEEETYFTCKMKGINIIASLCGAKNDFSGETEDRHIQFRSGPPGKISIRFPERDEAKAKDYFKGEYMQPYPRQIAVATILFKIGTTDYQLISEESATPSSAIWISESKKTNRAECESSKPQQGIERLSRELPEGPYQ